MSTNQLETTLHAIQTTKTQLKKQLANTTDPHIKQKIEHYINGYSQEEKRILDQLNMRIDLEITGPDKEPEEEEQEWLIYKNY